MGQVVVSSRAYLDPAAGVVHQYRSSAGEHTV
jgi:hypothetical protein